MMIGIVFISILVGGISALATLLAGGSFAFAFFVYMGAGSSTVFLLAAVLFLRGYLGTSYATAEAR